MASGPAMNVSNMWCETSESDTASTTKLDVQFPTGAPIASVSIQPKDGWTYTVKRGAPSHPVTDDDGDQITQVVDEITWTATPGSPGIKPGEFDTFVVSAGPLPTNVTSISFKALQTYSDNSVVRWIETAQPGQPEPQNPAPVLTLTATTGATATTAATAAGTASASRSDGTARGLGIAGIVVGALGLAAGAFGLATARRRARSGS